LQQALRETTVEERPLGEWASVETRAMARAVDDGDRAALLEHWRALDGAVGAARERLRELTGVDVRTIDLARNAFRQHSADLDTRVGAKFDADDAKAIRQELRLDSADADRPRSPEEEAEGRYATPAKLLWDALSVLGPWSIAPQYTVVRVLLDL